MSLGEDTQVTLGNGATYSTRELVSALKEDRKSAKLISRVSRVLPTHVADRYNASMSAFLTGKDHNFVMSSKAQPAAEEELLRDSTFSRDSMGTDDEDFDRRSKGGCCGKCVRANGIRYWWVRSLYPTVLRAH